MENGRTTFGEGHDVDVVGADGRLVDEVGVAGELGRRQEVAGQTAAHAVDVRRKVTPERRPQRRRQHLETDARRRPARSQIDAAAAAAAAAAAIHDVVHHVHVATTLLDDVHRHGRRSFHEWSAAAVAGRP